MFALGAGGEPLLVLNRALLLDPFKLFPSTSLSSFCHFSFYPTFPFTSFSPFLFIKGVSNALLGSRAEGDSKSR